MEFDPKKKVIEELMQYLQGKDDEDLGGAMKPQGMEMEVSKVEGMPEGAAPEAPKAEGMSDGDGDECAASPEMSDEDLNELIEALQQKMG